MFMLLLYRYITGYVYFEGFGIYPEKFLNLSAKCGIAVIKPKINKGSISGYMSVKNYKRIRKIAVKSRMRLKIKKRFGLRFIIEKYKLRLGIPVGLIIYFLIIFYMQSFVWQISIVGNETIPDYQIMEQLDKIGFYEGVPKSKVTVTDMNQRFLINNGRVSWAAINISGTKATFDMRETKKKKNENSDILPPCNIVASVGGTIKSIRAYSGTVCVKKGEAVAEGDLLVSGAKTLSNGITSFSHSKAVVYAQTKRKVKVFVPFKQISETVDSKGVKRCVLTVFGKDIPLFAGTVDYKCKTEKENRDLVIGGVKVPISITRKRFYRITECEYLIDETTAKAGAKTKMLCKAFGLYSDEIQKCDSIEFKTTNKGVYCTGYFTCLENIARLCNIDIESMD